MSTADQRVDRSRSSEYSLLVTATMCLVAAGAVLVYSSSSAEALLTEGGDPSYYLKRYLVFGALGLAVMGWASRVNLERVRAFTPPLLITALVLLVAVKLPGLGVTVNGATRWLGFGGVRFQPSEVAKLALVLYAAMLIARDPGRVRSLRDMHRPLLWVIGAVCVLVALQPDLGTDIVICLAMGAMLVAAGARMRDLALITGALALVVLAFSVVEPYRLARLTAFINPGADPSGAGFQSLQAKIAIGSGGVFGIGPGESVQKVFYLPEAHTDMILAVVGEEFGLVGIAGLLALYGTIAYAGLRAAKQSRDAFAKLLALGITSLIVCQALLNFAAVLGMAPLTGVPLPLISYGNSNLIVIMAGLGLLMNVARGAHPARMRVITGGRARAVAGVKAPRGAAVARHGAISRLSAEAERTRPAANGAVNARPARSREASKRRSPRRRQGAPPTAPRGRASAAGRVEPADRRRPPLARQTDDWFSDGAGGGDEGRDRRGWHGGARRAGPGRR